MGTSEPHSSSAVRTASFWIVALLILVFVVFWTVAPSVAIARLPLMLDENQDRIIPGLSQTWSEGEFRVPLIIPGGRLDRTFPDGVPMEFEGNEEGRDDIIDVIESVFDISEDAGLAHITDDLLSRETRPYVSEPLFSPNGDLFHPYVYPYSYPVIDNVISGVLTPELVATRGDQLVELSSALLYADRAASAYSLLNHMRKIENTCSAQLNLALTVAIGFSPPATIVDDEFAEAVRLCPDEPGVLATYSKVVLARDTRGTGVLREYALGDLGQENQALALAIEAQDRFPAHVAGYSAEALIQLEIADKYAEAGVHPFTARWMYRRALDLLDAVAVVQPNDPTIEFGRAQAMAGLGLVSEAVDVAAPHLDSFTNAYERVRVVEALYGWALEAGRPPEALEFQEQTASWRYGAYGWRQFVFEEPSYCRSLFPVGFHGERYTTSLRGIVDSQGGPAEPHWRGTCNVHLVDATGGQFPSGADAFNYFDYIPLYRYDWVSQGVLKVLADELISLEVGNPADHEGFVLALILKGDWSDLGEDPGVSIERLQDAYRRLGRYDDAEWLLRKAIENRVAPVWSWQDRLGEVQFIQGRFTEAVESFNQAARAGNPEDAGEWAYRVGYYPWDLAAGPAWASIKQAAALHQLKQREAARTVLQELYIEKPEARQLSYSEWDPGLQEIARSTLLGTVQLHDNKDAEAVQWLENAIHVCSFWQGTEIDPCASGTQHNNLAMALLKSGRTTEALSAMDRAMGSDPKNAMFIEGFANLLEAEGDIESAKEYYRDSISTDWTQFTAHNNLGVILASQGDLSAATEHFRASIGGNEQYPVGWFNLGVALEHSSDVVSTFLSQGALGRAARLDPSFREVDLDWVSDTTVYDPGLDLSKPLASDWVAGANRKPIPVGFSATLLLASVLLIVRAVIGDDVYGRVVEKALGWARSLKLNSRWSPLGEVTAIALCSVILATGMAFQTGWNLWLTVFNSLGALLLCLSFVSIRRLLQAEARHQPSAGGTVVGLLATPFGAAFSPVPTLRDQEVSARVRWAPIAFLAGVALLAMCATWLSGVPLLRLFAQASILLVASSLVPVEPFDGSVLSRRAGLVLGVLLMIPTVVLDVRWL